MKTCKELEAALEDAFCELEEAGECGTLEERLAASLRVSRLEKQLQVAQRSEFLPLPGNVLYCRQCTRNVAPTVVHGDYLCPYCRLVL